LLALSLSLPPSLPSLSPSPTADARQRDRRRCGPDGFGAATGTSSNRYLIYARTGGPEVKASKAVSLFYVERGMAGFSLGQRLKDKCGMRASPTAELVFENVPLPAANLIGQPGGATVSTETLPGERSGSLLLTSGRLAHLLHRACTSAQPVSLFEPARRSRLVDG